MIFSKSSWWLGARIMPKQDGPEWKFQTYKGNKLVYDMLCEPISSDNKNKEEDDISSNHLINLKILTTNKYIFLVCRQCA